MTDLDREQLKRDCGDALEALHRDQRVDGIAALADAIRTLGPTYRAHEPARGDPDRSVLGFGPGPRCVHSAPGGVLLLRQGRDASEGRH